MIRDDATRAQIAASAPDRSTWVSANAGSGKTRVLTDRVARLLYHGAKPEKILCLTYTKAAASEMQNRLFERLGGWTMAENKKLEGELRQMGEDGDITDADLRRARQMFATAIDTPGGLKIQTIHSFCASLLRQFPLEAGVTRSFRELDDRQAARLRDEVIEAMSDGPDGAAVDAMAQHFTGAEIADLTREIVSNAPNLRADRNFDAICADLGLNPDGPDWLASIGPFDGDREALKALVAAGALSGTNDQKLASSLTPLLERDWTDADAPILEAAFLTGEKAKEPFSAKIGSIPTKSLRGELGAHMDPINALMARVEAAREARLQRRVAEKTHALFTFAAPFLAAYEARKTDLGVLDFDDLIQRARALLEDPSVADWVLYRLDGGVDHILVDEAQDTSPSQWAVIDHLAREFTAGEGARTDIERTLFVVGDKKQSIYSFQGAAPDAFDGMRDIFADRFAGIGAKFAARTLDYSFRSAPPVLDFIDQALKPRQAEGLGDHLTHLAFQSDKPGRVDLWPLIDEAKTDEDDEWFAPVDRVAPDHHMVQLAEHIATWIATHVGQSQPIVDKSGARRALRFGDVLILVQRRSGLLFREIIRACKARGVPMAGADRLKLGAELAVKDLTALLSFLATPEDDLSLAAVLKSPIFGWSEAELYALAHPRPARSFLWQALRERGDDDPTRQILSDLLESADFLRPYDLIERILTRHNARARFLGRLGQEAQEGIDAFLTLALNYEQTEVPSLTGFLGWLAEDDVEIKRQMDNAGDQVRVMTVHGAKGLEAPVVILPDTHVRQPRGGGQIVTDGDQTFWGTAATERPKTLTRITDRLKKAQADERNRLCLLYTSDAADE